MRTEPAPRLNRNTRRQRAAEARRKAKAENKPDPAWTPFVSATGLMTPEKRAALIETFKAQGVPEEQVEQQIDLALRTETYLNSIYQVQVRSVEEDPGDENIPIKHLSIKRIDKRPIRDWRHLQRIKNEIVGPEYEAVELFPAESRLVDTANQYHLWVFDRAGFTIPLGWASQRLVIDAADIDPATEVVQREFEQ